MILSILIIGSLGF